MDEEGLSAPLVPLEPLACLLPLVTNQVPLEPNGTPDASDDQSLFTPNDEPHTFKVCNG